MPLPLNKLAALKLIPMSFLFFAPAVAVSALAAQFRRLLQVLGDAVLHAQFFVAWHLQNHDSSPGPDTE